MKIYKAAVVFIFFIVLTLAGCKKDDKPPISAKSSGDFVAKIDDQAWSAHDFKCYYYPKFNDLYIYAVDLNDRVRLEMVVYINPARPEDKYVFEGNGTHSGAAFINCGQAY